VSLYQRHCICRLQLEALPVINLVINNHIRSRDRYGIRTVAVRHKTRSALISFANRATMILNIRFGIITNCFKPTLQVVGTEGMSPLRDAVCLIYGYKTYLRCADHLHETFVVEAFRSHISVARQQHIPVLR